MTKYNAVRPANFNQKEARGYFSLNNCHFFFNFFSFLFAIIKFQCGYYL